MAGQCLTRGGFARGRVNSKKPGSWERTCSASQSRSAASPVGAGDITGPLKPCGGSARTTIVGVWVFGPPNAYATSIDSRIGVVPLLVVGGRDEIRVQVALRQARCEHGVVEGRVPHEELRSPRGEERVDRVLAVRGPGRLEDTEHPVREGVGRDHGLTALVGNGRRHAVVVADLEAVRPPGQDEIALRCDLLEPAGRDPHPRTARIHEHFHGSHVSRVPTRGGTG